MEIKKLVGITLGANLLMFSAVGSIVGYVGFNAMDKEIKDLKDEVSELKAGYKFDSKGAFDRAVAGSIDRYIQAGIDKNIEQKYVKYKAAQEEDIDGKAIYGNDKARFTLIEFASLECGYCGKYWETPKAISDASNGYVNVEWRNFPLPSQNPAAYNQAVAAECVAEQKGNRGRYVFLNEVFNNTGYGGRGVPDLAALVSGVGADLTEFKQCMQSGRGRGKVDEDLAFARENGVNSTPTTVIVDNYTGRSQKVSGAQPAQAVMAAIQKMKAEADEGSKS